MATVAKCSLCGQPVTGGHNRRTCGRTTSTVTETLPTFSATADKAEPLNPSSITEAYLTVENNAATPPETAPPVSLTPEEIATWWQIQYDTNATFEKQLEQFSTYVDLLPDDVREKVKTGNPDIWEELSKTFSHHFINEARDNVTGRNTSATFSANKKLTIHILANLPPERLYQMVEVRHNAWAHDFLPENVPLKTLEKFAETNPQNMPVNIQIILATSENFPDRHTHLKNLMDNMEEGLKNNSEWRFRMDVEETALKIATRSCPSTENDYARLSELYRKAVKENESSFSLPENNLWFNMAMNVNIQTSGTIVNDIAEQVLQYWKKHIALEGDKLGRLESSDVQKIEPLLRNPQITPQNLGRLYRKIFKNNAATSSTINALLQNPLFDQKSSHYKKLGWYQRWRMRRLENKIIYDPNFPNTNW